MEKQKLRAGILVPSDRISAGVYEDQSGRDARALLEPVADVVEMAVVPDERDRIRNILIAWCDEKKLDVVFTLGGTGLGPRDVTPEATRDAIERELPALITALLVQGLASTKRALLSRAVAA